MNLIKSLVTCAFYKRKILYSRKKEFTELNNSNIIKIIKSLVTCVFYKRKILYSSKKKEFTELNNSNIIKISHESKLQLHQTPQKCLHNALTIIPNAYI